MITGSCTHVYVFMKLIHTICVRTYFNIKYRSYVGGLVGA